MADPRSDWRRTSLPEVLLRDATAVADARGSFTELWRAAGTAPLTGEPFVQANLSRSQPRVLRGLHLHRRQWDLWSVISGDGVVALVDVRPAIDGDAPPVTELITLHPGSQLLIPRYVAHGFYARTEIVLAYLVTREYDGTDELGFAWDDPEVGVPWPDASPILSDRDQANPSLRGLLDRLRRDAATDQGQPSSR